MHWYPEKEGFAGMGKKKSLSLHGEMEQSWESEFVHDAAEWTEEQAEIGNLEIESGELRYLEGEESSVQGERDRS